MADVKFDQVFAPAEATRGSWAPIDGSTISGGIPSASRGRYAQLNYIIGSEPGALSIALSGGTVTLPVSTVTISDPLSIKYPDTSVYASNGSILSYGVSTYDFGLDVENVEVFNLDSSNNVYISFNSSTFSTITAQGMPLLAEGYYSIDRVTQLVYIANANGTPTDVRVIGHYRA